MNQQVITSDSLAKLKVGDKLIRLLGGIVQTKVIILNIQDGIITVTVEKKINNEKLAEKVAQYTGIPKVKLMETLEGQQLPTWEFSAVTGMEIDLELGWDGIKVTGSYLAEPEK